MREHHRTSSRPACRKTSHIIQCDVGSLGEMRRHYADCSALQSAPFPTLLPMRKEWQEKKPKLAPAPFKPLVGYTIPKRTVSNVEATQKSETRVAQVRLEPLDLDRPAARAQKDQPATIEEIRTTAQELKLRIASMEMGIQDMKRTYGILSRQLESYEEGQ